MRDMENTQNKLRKKTISLTPRHWEMIEMIQKQIGSPTSTAVIYRGIEELYMSLFPAYKYGGNNGMKMPKVDEENAIAIAEIKAKSKIAGKKIEEDAKWKPKIEMCENMLHGSVETEGNHRFCVFRMHTEQDSVIQRIPLAQVDPIVAETSLFSPDKETVLASRQDLKAEFAE